MLSLLRTKIQLPPPRARHIPRERLIRQLNQGLQIDARLTLVSAPAGFGKSSCLVAWAHQQRQSGASVAWYALDERDNDPARFAAYLLGAFQQADPPLPALPVTSDPIGLEETIHTLLNATAQVQSPVILILDDYHLIADERIHAALSLMVEYLPLNLRLVIGTRADPPLQLARLRSQGAITEIRMADLRFTTEEITRWLYAVLGWKPSPRTLNQLDLLTEGWAAALALIMMSEPLADEPMLEGQLARYSRSQRQIFDYFAQEVFERQPDDVKAFLLETSVLRWLQPDLCQSLTGRVDAQRLLDHLSTESLFIIPLSEHEPLFRYHHLFEHFLRDRFRMTQQERFPLMHRRAAEWHLAHQHVIEAVSHALESGDFDYAARLIEDHAWERLTSRGEITTLMGWLPQFEAAVLMRRPRLCLYFSRALYLTGDIERSQSYVQLAADALADADADQPDRLALQAITFNYLATLAAYRGETDAARTWIARARAQQHAVEPLDRVRIANTDAHLQFLTGNLSNARRAYQEALDLAQALDHHYLMLDAHAYLAQIDVLGGDLNAVEVRCSGLMRQYEASFGPLSAIMLPLAFVRYRRGQIAEAEALLREAIALARHASIPDILWSACLLLADVQLARGEFPEAEACIDQALAHAQGFHSPLMQAAIDAARARVLLRCGQADEALALIQPATVANQLDDVLLTAAQVCLSIGEPSQACQQITTLIDRAEALGHHGVLTEAYWLRAQAHQADGALDQALRDLGEALALAQRQGCIQPFIEGGAAVRRLLRLAVERDICAEYAAYLLEIEDQPAQHPSDTLTEREIDVLRRIADGASNQQIADSLVISVGTVKSHIHHLMSKLSAANRTEAVARARSLKLLSD